VFQDKPAFEKQEGVDMRGIRLRNTVKSLIAIVCAACFLTMSLGSVSRAIAADTWESWPKKTAEPGVQPPPPPADTSGAATAGDTAGKKTSKGISSGTIGWIALGTAAVVGVVIAAGSGGSSSSSPSCSQ
jgi:hypothetical protein